MNAEDLRVAQQEAAVSLLGSLMRACQRRYLASARLLEVPLPAIDRLIDFGFKSRVSLWPLMPAYEVVCTRYRARFYSPHMPLLPEPDRAPDQAWLSWYYHMLLPELVRDDSVVRNVLRCLGGLPCASPEDAAAAIKQHFAEMMLPSRSSDGWPEDWPSWGG